ncbi:MAG: energy-coupling factor transporter transmembrane protein EcfT, partial [Oscillospiraceae bacterium]|nr:energy-coupling factor transporter transmembrane protein EcfT [Oscillospiraceae bacterium]
MLKDITIGQYYVADSVIHRLDPRTKILLVLGYIVMLFFAKDLVGMIPAFLLLAAAYLLAKIPGRMILKSIKPILPILLLT